ncbi:MAG: response regulator [Planctomycetes bacterium]|nr:response regulator [Planctomycetota bacterium]
MSDGRPCPCEKCAESERELGFARRRLRQLERTASTSESIATQSKRAMLRVNRDNAEMIERLRVTAQELEDAKLRAEEASDAKGKFLATMSHEMRTPLNGILGSLELLDLESFDSGAKELVQVMHRSATALLSIVNDVLDFSKIEAGQMELENLPFQLRDCIQGVLDLEASNASKRGIHLFDTIAEDLPLHVVGDSCRLRQVLLNLVDNALKFTSEGQVEVRVERHETRKNQIVFRVRDTGCGIKAESVDAIFDAFSQEDSSTSRRFGGTGLGLAICRQIVELMGGSIRVESEVGRGSEFIFDCTLAGADKAADAHDAEIGEIDVAPSRVLVVDDNSINRLVASRVFEKLGCEVLCAEDGAVGLRVLAESDVDIVFMDCSMPVMDGFEATRRIRELDSDYSRIPIVAMTANAMRGDRERCLAAGMDDYVTKPIRIRTIRLAAGMDDYVTKPIRIRTIRELLQRYRPAATSAE